MGKSFKKAATIIGIAALAVTGIGLGFLVAGAGIGLSTALGITAIGGLTFGTLGAIGVAALSIGSMPSKPQEQTGAATRGSASFNENAVGVFAFGRTMLPCALVYEEQTGTEPDRVVHDVFAHCWHRIEGYVSLTVGADAGPETVTFSGDAATGAFANLLWWSTADGTQTTALTGTQFDYNNWPSDAVFSGVTHSGLVWNVDDAGFQAKFGTIPSQIEVVADCAWLYDPREDTSVGGSGSQDLEDPDTWSYNDGNAVLVLLRFLIGEYNSSGTLLWGRGAGYADIDMDSFIAMADICDETVDAKPRYRLGGVHELDGDWAAFVQRWESETGGKLSKSGGVYRVWVPHDDLTPLTTITENDLLAGLEVGHTVGGDIASFYNTARGRYIDPTQGYRGFPYPEVSESSAVTDDGGLRVLTQDFSWVQDVEIAQRIARIKVRRSRFQRIWSVPMGWKGQGPNYRPFTVHALNIKETGGDDQLVRVIGRRRAFNGPTVLLLQQEDASIYDDTIPLGDPHASNTIPTRLDRFQVVPRGVDGSDGLNVARARIYQRAASSPALPSATVTFTFATGGMTGLNNGWTATIPSGSNPLYISEATAAAAATTDTIAAGEWASPVVLVENGAPGSNGSPGADGINSATVFLYQRTTSNVAPSVPGSTLTYTFSTGALSGTLGSWTQSVPAASAGKYLWVTTATALGTGSTDTIASGEWATVRLMTQDGEGTWTPVLSSGMAQSGKTFSKTSGVDGWNEGFYSSERYGACSISFQPAQSNLAFMIGLNSDPSTDNGYSSIDYAMYCTTTTLEAYESGSAVGTLSGYAAGDVLEVNYDGNHVRYLKNGTILRTVAVAGAKFGADSSFYHNATANNVVFAPINGGKVDLATQVLGQLTTAFAAAGLINTNISVNADGSLTGAGGGAPVISSLSGSVATGQLTANVVAALQAVVGNLAAIRADLGSITAGSITFNSSGAFIRLGTTTAFESGVGLYIEYNGGNPRIYIGDASGNYLSFSTATGVLKVKGTVDINQAETSVTPSWTSGWSSAPTGNVYYRRSGNLVFVRCDGACYGTSNSGNFSFTLPSPMPWPAAQRQMIVSVYNQGSLQPATLTINTDGTCGVVPYTGTAGGFSGSGNKGFTPGSVFVYSVD